MAGPEMKQTDKVRTGWFVAALGGLFLVLDAVLGVMAPAAVAATPVPSVDIRFDTNADGTLLTTESGGQAWARVRVSTASQMQGSVLGWTVAGSWQLAPGMDLGKVYLDSVPCFLAGSPVLKAADLLAAARARIKDCISATAPNLPISNLGVSSAAWGTLVPGARLTESIFLDVPVEAARNGATITITEWSMSPGPEAPVQAALIYGRRTLGITDEFKMYDYIVSALRGQGFFGWHGVSPVEGNQVLLWKPLPARSVAPVSLASALPPLSRPDDPPSSAAAPPVVTPPAGAVELPVAAERGLVPTDFSAVKLTTTLGLALALMILIALPTQLLDSTLSSNADRIDPRLAGWLVRLLTPLHRTPSNGGSDD